MISTQVLGRKKVQLSVMRWGSIFAKLSVSKTTNPDQHCFIEEQTMKNISRLTIVGLLLCGMLALASRSFAQDRAPIIDQVAKTYGVDSWDKVEAVRYTWNAEIVGLFKASHKWEWEPKTGKVSFEGVGKDGKPIKVTYDSSQLSSQSD